MPDFYTLDRLGALALGSTLTLTTFNDIQPPFLQEHVDTMFPNGVSRHGDSYFLSQPQQSNPVNEVVELLAEYIRRAHYPLRPSRFQSWFGTESVQGARDFRTEFAGGSGAIWRVRSQESFRADMRLLTLQNSNLVRSWRVHQYWEGQTNSVSPFWEMLLVPPIEVLELVEPVP